MKDWCLRGVDDIFNRRIDICKNGLFLFFIYLDVQRQHKFYLHLFIFAVIIRLYLNIGVDRIVFDVADHIRRTACDI